MDTEEYLKEVVTELASGIGVRTYLDLGALDRAAEYIVGQFSSFGYQVARQSFLFAGNTYQNIIAELKGIDSPETLIIVGAHYDSVNTTPGADDNGSGVAGLLGLAQAMAGKRLRKTVRFVAFALEERPVCRSSNMGSYHYAQSLQEKNENVDGMICLEMLGFFRNGEGSQRYPFPLMNRRFPKEGNFIALVGNGRSKELTERIAASFKHATDLPFVTLNAPAIVVGIDFSDHWSFNTFGYNALMVTDTAFYRNPHYHEPTDLPDTLDYERMAKVVKGLIGALEEWGNG